MLGFQQKIIRYTKRQKIYIVYWDRASTRTRLRYGKGIKYQTVN